MLTKGKVNKARPLCDLIKLNTILAQEYVAGKAPIGTHVTSDLLNTGRFYMALYPPTGVLTSRLRGYLSATTSRGHLGTTYMVSPEDKHRDITRTKEDKKRTHHIQPVLLLHSHVLHPLQPRPASSTATSCLLHSHPRFHSTYLPRAHPPHINITRHWTSLPVRISIILH
jgi:hypothetical protein